MTLENHTIIGGLADAVASSLVFGGGGVLPQIQRIGLPDEFLGTGALPTLHERYGLSTEAIVRSVHGWLG